MKNQKKLWLPQYWPMWLMLGFFWCLAYVPYRVQLFLGKNLGRLFFYIMSRRRKIGLINLQHCFPDWSEAKRIATMKQTFQALGMGLFESALAWWGSAEKLKSLVHWKGLEHLHAAIARGKGVMVLSYHSTIIELAAQFICLEHPAYLFYRAQKNPMVQYILERAQTRYARGLILRTEFRALVKALKQGEVVCYLGDQDYGRKHSDFVPFFAVEKAATINMVPRITRLTDAAIVCVRGGRRSDGTGYDLEFLPALENFPTGNEIADLTRLNQLFADGILEYPEQYFWVHRRFKTRPEGEPSFYDV